MLKDWSQRTLSEAERLMPLEDALSEGAAAVEQVLDLVLKSPEGPESRFHRCDIPHD